MFNLQFKGFRKLIFSIKFELRGLFSYWDVAQRGPKCKDGASWSANKIKQFV